MTPLQDQVQALARNMRFSGDVEDALVFALSDRLKDRPWKHAEPDEIERRLAKDEFPYLQDVVYATEFYLSQLGRTSDIDRFLIDLLLASEVFAYAWQRKHAVSVERWVPLLNVILLFAVASWLNDRFWYGVATVLSILTVVVHIQRERKAKRLQKAMRETYQTLSRKSVSVEHLRGNIAKSIATGVVWPSMLHRLLDDTASRVTRF